MTLLPGADTQEYIEESKMELEEEVSKVLCDSIKKQFIDFR